MMISFDAMADRLREGGSFLLLTHRRPDGDTLGSACALCLGLRQLGKEAYLLYNPEITPRYSALVEKLWAEEGYSADIICSVDVADRSLLPNNAPQDIDLAIDHHPSHRQFAAEYLVQGEAAACGEIIYELLKTLGVEMTKDIADALYTAVSTDTGCFRFNNTTPHTHLVAAECMAAGADYSEINYRCFRLKTRARVMLEGHIYSTITTVAGGKAAGAVITRDIIEKLGADDDDLDNLSSLLVEIDGIKTAALLTENKSRDSFKVSVRSNDSGVNASDICRKFGGGGHAGAAGCTIEGSDGQKALEMMLAAAKEAVDA